MALVCMFAVPADGCGAFEGSWLSNDSKCKKQSSCSLPLVKRTNRADKQAHYNTVFLQSAEKGRVLGNTFYMLKISRWYRYTLFCASGLCPTCTRRKWKFAV